MVIALVVGVVIIRIMMVVVVSMFVFLANIGNHQSNRFKHGNNGDYYYDGNGDCQEM